MRDFRHHARRATVIVPVALLSAAWTATLATGPVSSTSTATAPRPEPLPDGPSVPIDPIEEPASVSVSDATTSTGTVGGVGGDATQIVATSSTNGIPSAALAAYQRAETVINAADKACRLSWQLVAAIGRVESDHGRFGGSALDADGVATPEITGIALDGTRGTALIRDTDGGQYDGDQRFDRAVGPMQFIPSTWAVVGVDADNDGVRNPQDVDDAALATAVYLCSGNEDLSTLTGQRAAVFRYNHAERYVDLVLDVMDSYRDGDFTAVPNNTVAAGYLTPAPVADPQPVKPTDAKGAKPAAQAAAPTETPTSQQPTPEGNEAPSEQPTPENGAPAEPAPTKPPVPVKVPPLPATGIQPVDDVLTLAEAIVQCTLDGHLDNLLDAHDPFDQCVTGYTKS